MESKAIVNNIIPFSNVDGPGNRLAIFFQGCNINCVYCHNHETINKCINCMSCVEGCPSKALKESNGHIVFDEKLCVECDQCIKECPNSSSPRTKAYSVSELLRIIEEYKPFIRGITVSGGEPTLQYGFITELFKHVKLLGLTCFVDTNVFFNREQISGLIDVTDKFMVDIKALDSIKKLCGTDLKNNMDNLKYLLSRDKVYEVRTVLIEEYLDMENTVAAVASILKDYPEVIYKLIRVHSKGLNREQKEIIEGRVPDKARVEAMADTARKIGVAKIEVIGL